MFVRAVCADDAPHRDGPRQRTDKSNDLQGKAQPVPRHHDLVRLVDHRLGVRKRPDVHGHRVIQVEAACGALPGRQIRNARPRSLNVIGIPGKCQCLAMPDNALGHQSAQPWCQLRGRYGGQWRDVSQWFDREVVHPNVQHGAKRRTSYVADAREYRIVADRSAMLSTTLLYGLINPRATRRASTGALAGMWRGTTSTGDTRPGRGLLGDLGWFHPVVQAGAGVDRVLAAICVTSRW